MSCDRCPCPDACRQLPAYCEWAARETPNPIEIRHICDASRAAPAAASDAGPVAQVPVQIELLESVRLTRLMNACPDRTKGPGCGCSGALCGRRGGRVVSHLDCFECLTVADAAREGAS